MSEELPKPKKDTSTSKEKAAPSKAPVQTHKEYLEDKVKNYKVPKGKQRDVEDRNLARLIERYQLTIPRAISQKNQKLYEKITGETIYDWESIHNEYKRTKNPNESYTDWRARKKYRKLLA